MATTTIALLTLEKHLSGIWITKLLSSLEQLQATVEVVTLESTLNCIQSPFAATTRIVINRISDATQMYKETVALLQCCESLWNIVVWNGAAAFSLCANKWCHHSILQQAGLGMPKTVRLHAALIHDDNKVVEGLTYPLLRKPNAGSFGNGIVKLDDDQGDSSAQPPSTHDNMAILQEFVEPRNHRLYRVWFLRGRVQCGIMRQYSSTCDDTFTTGCAANGVCSLRSTREEPTLFAFPIPAEVRREVEELMLPRIPSAHCGSVEYLVNAEGERLYFDINLLSTLPIVENVMNADEVWGSDYDPWMDLARAILEGAQEGS